MHQTPSDEKSTKQSRPKNTIKSRQVNLEPSKTGRIPTHQNVHPGRGHVIEKAEGGEGGPHPRFSDFRFPAGPSWATIGISDALHTAALHIGTFPNNHHLHPKGRRFSHKVVCV